MTDDLTCTGCGEYVGTPIADRIEVLEAENKRLREALHSVAYWSRFEGHLPWCRDIIRAALAQTSTKEGEE